MNGPACSLYAGVVRSTSRCCTLPRTFLRTAETHEAVDAGTVHARASQRHCTGRIFDWCWLSPLDVLPNCGCEEGDRCARDLACRAPSVRVSGVLGTHPMLSSDTRAQARTLRSPKHVFASVGRCAPPSAEHDCTVVLNVLRELCTDVSTPTMGPEREPIRTRTLTQGGHVVTAVTSTEDEASGLLRIGHAEARRYARTPPQVLFQRRRRLRGMNLYKVARTFFFFSFFLVPSLQKPARWRDGYTLASYCQLL